MKKSLTKMQRLFLSYKNKLKEAHNERQNKALCYNRGSNNYRRKGLYAMRLGLLYRYSEKQVNDLVSKNIKEVARNIVYCMAIKIPNTKGYMKVKDAAEYLGVQDSSIYDRIKVGHTKKYMYEGITYISFADIEKYETQLKLRGR